MLTIDSSVTGLQAPLRPPEGVAAYAAAYAAEGGLVWASLFDSGKKKKGRYAAYLRPDTRDQTPSTRHHRPNTLDQTPLTRHP